MKTREPLSLIDSVAVAAILGTRRSHVLSMARAGVIPCIHVGRLVRFNEKEVLEWIESRRFPSNS